MIPSSFYEIVEKDISGNEVLFEKFRGKVVYAVNVASQCGYTHENYEMFRYLKKYRPHGTFTLCLYFQVIILWLIFLILYNRSRNYYLSM